MASRDDMEKQERENLREEYEEKKKIAENAMINQIVDYVKSGIFPKSKADEFMICYNFVYAYSDKGFWDELLNYHNNIIKEVTEEFYKRIKDKTYLDFIDTFISCTNNLNTLIYYMDRIFSYISTNHLSNINGEPAYDKKTMCEFSMDIYKNYFFDKVSKKLFIALNQVIKEERKGNMDYRKKIQDIVNIIISLDLVTPNIKKEKQKILWRESSNSEPTTLKYQEAWFNNYEKETEIYAKEKANKDIHNNSAPEYIKCEIKYINEEKERQQLYLNQQYHSKINDINYRYLINNNAEEITNMDSGVKYMFKTKKLDELKDVYILFKLDTPSLLLAKQIFLEYIKERGNLIYANKEILNDPKKFIPELIKLQKEMNELVSFCFDNDKDFQNYESKAFSQLMSRDVYAKQLSNYVDYCMRNGFKGKSEEEIERTLQDIISIFKNLNSKLAFQNDSDKKMSIRLIKTKPSLNTEKSFISKLKQEQGVSYVSKKNEMINDLEKSKNESEGYKSSSSMGAPNGIKFNVTVISQSAWEINKSAMEKFIFPPFLNYCIEDFEKYYFARHQGTKLLWCLGLSSIEIQYLYLKSKNISSSTLPQLLCLLNLEKYEKLTLEKLSQLIGCNIQIILSDIQGLIFNVTFNPKGQADKGIILANIDPAKKDFKPSTEVSINKNFSLTRMKFNTLPLPQKKSDAEMKRDEEEESKINHKYQENILQASITRIMKSRIGQETSHTWLVNEVSKQVDLFRAQPQQIKENIEKLIEKNIIKRNTSNYEYIA